MCESYAEFVAQFDHLDDEVGDVPTPIAMGKSRAAGGAPSTSAAVNSPHAIPQTVTQTSTTPAWESESGTATGLVSTPANKAASSTNSCDSNDQSETHHDSSSIRTDADLLVEATAARSTGVTTASVAALVVSDTTSVPTSSAADNNGNTSNDTHNDTRDDKRDNTVDIHDDTAAAVDPGAVVDDEGIEEIGLGPAVVSGTGYLEHPTQLDNYIGEDDGAGIGRLGGGFDSDDSDDYVGSSYVMSSSSSAAAAAGGGSGGRGSRGGGAGLVMGGGLSQLASGSRSSGSKYGGVDGAGGESESGVGSVSGRGSGSRRGGGIVTGLVRDECRDSGAGVTGFEPGSGHSGGGGGFVAGDGDDPLQPMEPAPIEAFELDPEFDYDDVSNLTPRLASVMGEPDA